MHFNGIHTLSTQLTLHRTHQAHYPSRQHAVDGKRAEEGQSFGELLQTGIASVSRAQQNHEALAAQAIINPDQVNVHDVTIAAAKADLSIRLARNIIDRALNAYREITSLR